MKIINSHYIPLPEPRWLIMDPQGDIYRHRARLSSEDLQQRDVPSYAECGCTYG